jgi:hypothetical protein
VERSFWTDPTSELTFMFSPSRGIHDERGGTPSLGDTIDSTALKYGMKTSPPKPLLHGSSFG